MLPPHFVKTFVMMTNVFHTNKLSSQLSKEKKNLVSHDKTFTDRDIFSLQVNSVGSN